MNAVPTLKECMREWKVGQTYIYIYIYIHTCTNIHSHTRTNTLEKDSVTHLPLCFIELRFDAFGYCEEDYQSKQGCSNGNDDDFILGQGMRSPIPHS